jgi:hypothetical protein
VAGDKTVINNIIQRLVKELTIAPYKFLAAFEIADRDIFYGREAAVEELAGAVGRHKVVIKGALETCGLLRRWLGGSEASPSGAAGAISSRRCLTCRAAPPSAASPSS